MVSRTPSTIGVLEEYNHIFNMEGDKRNSFQDKMGSALVITRYKKQSQTVRLSSNDHSDLRRHSSQLLMDVFRAQLYIALLVCSARTVPIADFFFGFT